MVGTADSLELDSYNDGSVNCRASSTWLASRHVPPFIVMDVLREANLRERAALPVRARAMATHTLS